MAQIQGVYFDAGNTLIELDYQFITERISAEGIEVEKDRVREAEYRARRRIDALYAIDRKTDRGMWWEYFATILDECQIRHQEKISQLLQRLQSDHRKNNLWRTPAPGAKQLLEGLKAEGRTTAVISNSDGRIQEVLQQAGLVENLDGVYDSALVGFEKPARELFEHALDAHQIPAHAAAYVGDLENVDVIGARNVGMHPILVNPLGPLGPLGPDALSSDSGASAPVTIVRNLSELARLFGLRP